MEKPNTNSPEGETKNESVEILAVKEIIAINRDLAARVEIQERKISQLKTILIASGSMVLSLLAKEAVDEGAVTYLKEELLQLKNQPKQKEVVRDSYYAEQGSSVTTQGEGGYIPEGFFTSGGSVNNIPNPQGYFTAGGSMGVETPQNPEGYFVDGHGNKIPNNAKPELK